MNTEQATQRFDEIMATISLLPDLPDFDVEGDTSEVEQILREAWIFPNLTRDMAEPEIYNAILCQAMKDNEDGFEFKLTSLLTHSAIKSIHDKCHDDEDAKPSKDDLYALSIAANVLWAIGNAPALFGVLNTLGHICSDYDLDIPELAITVIRPNGGVEGFANLNPYDILSGKVGAKEARAIARGLNNERAEAIKKDLLEAVKGFLNADNEGKE